jgi:hypothetical protein
LFSAEKWVLWDLNLAGKWVQLLSISHGTRMLSLEPHYYCKKGRTT